MQAMLANDELPPLTRLGSSGVALFVSLCLHGALLLWVVSSASPSAAVVAEPVTLSLRVSRAESIQPGEPVIEPPPAAVETPPAPLAEVEPPSKPDRPRKPVTPVKPRVAAEPRAIASRPEVIRPSPVARNAVVSPEKAVKPAVVTVTPVYSPAPRYPAIARRMGLEGRVLLRVVVNRDGSPDTVELVTGSGHDMLDNAALKTVRQWRFQVEGAVQTAAIDPVDVPIRFALQ